MRYHLFEKRSSIFLLIVAVLLNSSSIGNPGIGQVKTFVIAKNQIPAAIKKYNPSNAYLLFNGSTTFSKYEGVSLKSDTITNFKKFSDSLSHLITGYRLIFGNNNHIDSVWQLNTAFKITDKAFNIGKGFLRILAFDEKENINDEFTYNYMKKYTFSKQVTHEEVLAALLREYSVYSQSDRNKYSVNQIWALSIGIDEYKGGDMQKFRACVSDAESYNSFFKSQYGKFINGENSFFQYHEYLLTKQNATKDAILNALKDIAAKSKPNDYFVFNFSGYSDLISVDSVSRSTYFFPFDNEAYPKDFAKKSDAQEINRRLISLKTLQEYIQLIQAKNQLFISEAGPSEKFKTEFIRTLMQNSPLVASLLNKNRIIIVPNKIGMEGVCQGQTKGYINCYLTSLDSATNIFNIFDGEGKAEKVVFEIKRKASEAVAGGYGYFDIFFEKQFLQQYREIFGDEDGQTRGMKVKSKELQETVSSLTGKHYALIVGTDNYKGKGWNKLSNPVKDSRAIADELASSYGFEVQVLEDKPMDTVYKAIREYYRIAKPNDQLVVYFAGHGDVDDELLDDGFIVCSDSKSVEDDPVRNTYIPYMKLQKMLNNIPARQVLVLLDVCHGGTFDSRAFENEKREGEFNNISNRNVAKFLKDKLPLQTRKFLSSVGSEPAFDGKAGNHSPFANLLLQVLREKGSGSNGIVTLSDINAVLQTASMNETATLKISPHMADFGKVDAFSEFIFIPIEKKGAKE